MSTKHLTMHLAKNINKFLSMNVLILISSLITILIITGYEKMEVVFSICAAGLIAIGINFFTGRIMKQRIERMIKNSLEKIETQLYFDELTQVYNRKTGIKRLNEEIARSKRTGSPTVIAVVDIDNFKDINDTYGHLVGDKALSRLANQIKQSVRACDVVVRYGGEEFLIILPNTDEINALLALERVREQIARKPLLVGGNRIQLTVSIGLKEISFDEDAHTAINKADIALYQAKKNGKNRVEVYLNFAKNLN